jgi:hypothetical protein
MRVLPRVSFAEGISRKWECNIVSNNDKNKYYKFDKKYLHKLSILFGWKLNGKVAALSKFGSGEENLKLI